MEKIVKHVKKQRDDMRNIIAYLEALSGTESAMESGLEPRQHPPSASPSVIIPSPTHADGRCTQHIGTQETIQFDLMHTSRPSPPNDHTLRILVYNINGRRKSYVHSRKLSRRKKHNNHATHQNITSIPMP